MPQTIPMFMQIRKILSIIVMVTFVCSSIKSPVYAQIALEGPMSWLPKPGTMVHLSPEFTPAHLQGITIHPDNALQFDFLIHRGDESLTDAQKKEEYNKLVKYFLASLTIPDVDQWVNLSPYENKRIIKDNFGKTEMGRDLLAQDYLLKQITSSLIYPEESLGKKFWNRVYERAYKEYGASNIPVNTFNKVWIIPDEAAVYESGNTVYVLRNHLKVMLEEDYLSLNKNTAITDKTHTIGSQIIREIVLPELEKEVNEGKNFANLRQIYSGMILATWYKKALKESLLGKVYANQAKTKGVDQDPQTNEAIYQQYLKAFKKGVFNYIKEDVDKYTNQTIPRKYFSGGLTGFNATRIQEYSNKNPPSRAMIEQVAENADSLDNAVVSLDPDRDAVMMVKGGYNFDEEIPAIKKNISLIVNEQNSKLTPKEMAKAVFEGTYSEAISSLIESGDIDFEKVKDYADQLAGKLQNIANDIANKTAGSRNERPKIAKIYDHLAEMVRLVPQMVRASSDMKIEADDQKKVYNFQWALDQWAKYFRDSSGKMQMMRDLNVMGIPVSEDISVGKIQGITKQSQPMKTALMALIASYLPAGQSATVESVVKQIVPANRMTEFRLMSGEILDRTSTSNKNNPGAVMSIVLATILMMAIFFNEDKSDPVEQGQSELDSYNSNLNSFIVSDSFSSDDMKEVEDGKAELRQLYMRYQLANNRLEKVKQRLDVAKKNAEKFGITLENLSKAEQLIAAADVAAHIAVEDLRQAQQAVNSAYREMVTSHVAVLTHQKNLVNILVVKINDVIVRQRGQSSTVIEQMRRKLSNARASVADLERKIVFAQEAVQQTEQELAAKTVELILIPKQEPRVITTTHPGGAVIMMSFIQRTIVTTNSPKAVFFYRSIEKTTVVPSTVLVGLESAYNGAQKEFESAEKRYNDFMKTNPKGATVLANPRNVVSNYRNSKKKLEDAQKNLDDYKKTISAVIDDKTKGGIDLNSVNLNLQIKRDGQGVPLPLSQQDMNMLMQIQGFVPRIIEINPAVNLPILSELRQKLQPAPAMVASTSL